MKFQVKLLNKRGHMSSEEKQLVENLEKISEEKHHRNERHQIITAGGNVVANSHEPPLIPLTI